MVCNTEVAQYIQYPAEVERKKKKLKIITKEMGTNPATIMSTVVRSLSVRGRESEETNLTTVMVSKLTRKPKIPIKKIASESGSLSVFSQLKKLCIVNLSQGMKMIDRSINPKQNEMM
jgi:hypothetical protein